METKKCRKCGKEKTLDQFYRKSAATDGLTAQCKECINAHQKKYRDANPELMRRRAHEQYCIHREARRAAQRVYYLNNKDKWAESTRRRRATNEGRLAKNRQSAEWRKANLEKYTAEYQLNNAIKLGKINRPNICSMCGKVSNRIHGHHPDYTKPLEVVWLCETCHKAVHAADKVVTDEAQVEVETE